MVSIETINDELIKEVWRAGFSRVHMSWMDYNGPYFEENNYYETFLDFKKSDDYGFFISENVKAIIYNGEVVGILTRSFKDYKTRWLEVGIIIFRDDLWGKGIGKSALNMWVSETFKKYDFLMHIGLTTWSGNERMMALSKSMGFMEEARIRKVRYYKGVYYDSMKYGILREEWEEKNIF